MQAGLLSAERKGGRELGPQLGWPLEAQRSWDFMVSAMGSHWSVAVVSAVV